jgi:hypothetical protein
MVGDLSGRGALGLISRLATALLLSRFTSQKFVFFLARPNKEDLKVMRDLMTDEKLKPMLDKGYSLREVPAAIRYVSEKHARGKVVITLDGPRITAQALHRNYQLTRIRVSSRKPDRRRWIARISAAILERGKSDRPIRPGRSGPLGFSVTLWTMARSTGSSSPSAGDRERAGATLGAHQ